MSALDGPQTFVHINVDEWNAALKQLGGFPEIGCRAEIMSSVSGGIEEVWKRYAQPSDGPRPALVVPTLPLGGEVAGYEGRIFNVGVRKIIVATRTWLTTMNTQPIDREVSLFGHENGVFMRGKLLQLCFLAGCEEADHTLYRLAGLPQQKRSESELKTKLADYDAIPIEFRALERQLEIATTLSMPEVTLSLLRLRIENARRIMQTLS